MVETDASGHGLGAVLMQDNHPVAYFSRVLPQRVRQHSVYERELMAVVFAVQKWRHYLLGRQFVVRTDQWSMKYFLEQRLVSEDNQKWLTKLMGFHFDIQYRPGLENKAAEALSRMQPTLNCIAITTPKVLQLGEIKNEVATDEVLGKLVKDLQGV